MTEQSSEIGRRILWLRLRANLSQEDLAKSMNITRNTVSNWEHGKTEPCFSDLKSLCLKLDATGQFILFGHEVEAIGIS